MSNYYDLCCLTCSELPTAKHRVDTGWSNGNRMHKELLVVLTLRPELEALALAHQRLEPKKFAEYTDFNLFNDHPVPRWAFFFAEHVGHHIVVHSEYWNDAFFGCEKTAFDYSPEKADLYHRELKARENRNDCRLDHNHEGPCAVIRPDGK